MNKIFALFSFIVVILILSGYRYKTPDKGIADSDIPNSIGRKKVTFKLGSYNSDLEDFRDTALKSLDLLSKVFSSREFKDSIYKYDFPCSNGWYKPCEDTKNLIVKKCDTTVNLVRGSTVYADIVVDREVVLDLNILHPKGKTGSYGWAAACVYKINSYSWWLKNNRKQPLSEEYAIHLAHEYCHIIGYYHSDHPTSKDVSYRMGGIVRNILWRWSHKNAPKKPETPFYKKGIVVAAHPEASRVGLEILKKGGNAMDAAVAVQFALAVVYPNAGNIGGGGFLVYRDAKGGTTTLDYREKASGTASRDMYLDASGNVVPKKSTHGHLAAGVPGTVDGMVQAHAKYGKLSWKEVVQPAVDLARQGFKITDNQSKEFNNMRELFIQFNPSGAALIKAKGKWSAGEMLVQPELAQTFERIRDQGRAGFYEGETADYLVAEMNKGKGIISKQDLKDYKAIWREPIISSYKGYKVITMPPPSSGGIALTQLLHAVEDYPLAKWGHNQDSTVRLIVEAERRVYADRATHLGDPDFHRVPQAALLDAGYQKKRMGTMDWSKATLSSEVKAGVFLPKESEETTHYSIADEEGNSVSVTTTLNNSYGCLVFVKGAGFLLNNEMDDFSVKPGTPNSYGLIGGEANAIAPGKRMLSSMTPTIIEKDGKLFMVVGTPGGSTIITSVFQTILNVIDFGQDMQQAVTSPRFHHQWLPDEVYTEKGAFDAKTDKVLKDKGYKMVPRTFIGLVDAILKTPQGYQGGADPRGDDTSLGW